MTFRHEIRMVLASCVYDSRSRKRAFNTDTVHDAVAQPPVEVVEVREVGGVTGKDDSEVTVVNGEGDACPVYGLGEPQPSSVTAP